MNIYIYSDTEIDDCPICYATKSNVITDCKHMFCLDCLRLHVQKMFLHVQCVELILVKKMYVGSLQNLMKVVEIYTISQTMK